VLGVLMPLLGLVLLVLFRVCGYGGILFGEYANYASSDFVVLLSSPTMSIPNSC